LIASLSRKTWAIVNQFAAWRRHAITFVSRTTHILQSLDALRFDVSQREAPDDLPFGNLSVNTTEKSNTGSMIAETITSAPLAASLISVGRNRHPPEQEDAGSNALLNCHATRLRHDCICFSLREFALSIFLSSASMKE
jgi:hypothetical protein